MLLFYSISSIKCNAVPKLKLWFLFAPFFSNVGFVYGHVRIRPEIWTALGAFFSPDVSLNLFNCVRFYFLDIYVRIAFRFLISPLLLIGYAFRRLSSWVELSILIGVNELIFSVSLKRHLAGESGYESRFLVVCWLVAWSPWSVIPWSIVMDNASIFTVSFCRGVLGCFLRFTMWVVGLNLENVWLSIISGRTWVGIEIFLESPLVPTHVYNWNQTILLTLFRLFAKNVDFFNELHPRLYYVNVREEWSRLIPSKQQSLQCCSARFCHF